MQYLVLISLLTPPRESGVTTKGFGEFVGFTKRTFWERSPGAVGKGLDTDAIESAWKLRKSGISDDAIKTLA